MSDECLCLILIFYLSEGYNIMVLMKYINLYYYNGNRTYFWAVDNKIGDIYSSLK